MNVEEEFKNHISFEFTGNILNESRGYVTGLHDIIVYILQENNIYDLVKRSVVSGIRTSETYEGNMSSSGLDCFFNTYKITVKCTYSNREFDSDGTTHTTKSFVDGENGVVCTPNIEIEVWGNQFAKLVDDISTVLGHELTHMYNLYQFAKKNNLSAKEVFDNIRHNQKYANINRSVNSGYLPNEQAIADVLYTLNRMERNAYIGELEEELLPYADSITDAKTAWFAIRATDSYRKFKHVESNINVLLNELDEPSKRYAVIVTNKIMETKFTTFSQVRKYFAQRFESWKKKFIVTASKIAHDIYQKNNVDLDGNMKMNYKIKGKIQDKNGNN